MHHIRTKALAVLAVGSLVATACGGDDDGDADAAPADTTAAPADTTAAPADTDEPGDSGDAGDSGDSGETDGAADGDEVVDLASVCPNPVVIQTGWFPAADRAFFYGFAEPGGEIDAGAGVYRAPSKADPNLEVEIRAGGPLVGFQQGNALLYTDPDILIADQNLDAMLAASANFPTVAVMSPYDKFPQILLWNPEEVTATSIDELRESGTTVVVAENAVYADALVGLGLLDEGQVDKSYDGSPARFVASNGDFAQQGFSTSDPFVYEQQLDDWSKPVEYLYVNDAGYPVYGTLASTRPELIESEADCFSALIPAMQSSYVDFLNSPDETLTLIGELSAAYNNPSDLTPEALQYAVDNMRNELIDRGTALGDVDPARVQELIDLALPILQDRGADVDAAITADGLATNQFIDDSITFD